MARVKCIQGFLTLTLQIVARHITIYRPPQDSALINYMGHTCPCCIFMTFHARGAFARLFAALSCPGFWQRLGCPQGLWGLRLRGRGLKLGLGILICLTWTPKSTYNDGTKLQKRAQKGIISRIVGIQV